MEDQLTLSQPGGGGNPDFQTFLVPTALKVIKKSSNQHNYCNKSVKFVARSVDWKSLSCSLSVHLLCGAHLKLGFPTGRDSITFRDKGTEVPSLSRDKWTTGQAQNLATGRAGTAYQNPGRDAGRDNHYFSVKIWDGTRDETGQSLFFSYDFLF